MTIEMVPMLDKQACQLLTACGEQFINNNPDKVMRDAQGADTRIFNVEKKVPEFKVLFDKLVAAYKAAYGPPDYAFAMYNLVRFMPNNKGSGGGWHRDSYRFQAKAFCYLSDVTSEVGPLEYIPDTHKPLGKAFDYITKRGSTRYDAGEVTGTPQEVLGQAGSGFVLDTSGIHRGRPIIQGVRHACTLYAYQGSDASLQSLRNRFTHM